MIATSEKLSNVPSNFVLSHDVAKGIWFSIETYGAEKIHRIILKSGQERQSELELEEFLNRKKKLADVDKYSIKLPGFGWVDLF
jgi:hypothetical protein